MSHVACPSVYLDKNQAFHFLLLLFSKDTQQSQIMTLHFLKFWLMSDIYTVS